MMSRRTLMGSALAGAGLLLSACGLGGRLDGKVAAAVEAVEGVSGTDLDAGRNSRFGTSVTGTISVAASDETTGTEIFDEAMRAAVTVLHEEGEHDVIVGGLTGVLEDGTELTPLLLDPEFPTEDHRLEYVTASSLYSRYGLG